jgi:hypothetical protein
MDRYDQKKSRGRRTRAKKYCDKKKCSGDAVNQVRDHYQKASRANRWASELPAQRPDVRTLDDDESMKQEVGKGRHFCSVDGCKGNEALQCKGCGQCQCLCWVRHMKSDVKKPLRRKLGGSVEDVDVSRQRGTWIWKSKNRVIKGNKLKF